MPIGSYYQAMHREIQSQNIGPLPALTVVYSTERSCEIVKAEGQWHLVYDRYLGSTFHLMTRILYHATSPDYAEAFALKCVAQRLLSMGKLAQAQHLTYWYLLLHPSEHLTKDDHNTDRAHVTALQELFVMAHEVCHHQIKHDEAFRALHLANAELVYAAGKELAMRLATPTYTARRKLHKQHGFPTNVKFWNEGRELRGRQWDESKSVILEEIACDTFAFEAVARYAAKGESEPFIWFKSAFLALRYLRLLNYCDSVADSIATRTDVTVVDRRAVDTQIREQCLYGLFSSVYSRHFDQEHTKPEQRGRNVGSAIAPISTNLPKEMQQKFRSVRTEVNAQLYDPIVFRLPHLINDLLTKVDLSRPLPREDGTVRSEEDIFKMVEDATAANW